MRIAVCLCALFALLSNGHLPARADNPQNSDIEFFSRLVSERYVEPFRSGDIPRWIEAFAEDSVALHNRRAPDEGREAIRIFGEAVHSMFRLARYDVVVTHVRRTGGAVITRGTFDTRFERLSDGKSPWGDEHGKFVLVWEQQADGQWRIILDMGNSSN